MKMKKTIGYIINAILMLIFCLSVYYISYNIPSYLRMIALVMLSIMTICMAYMLKEVDKYFGNKN